MSQLLYKLEDHFDALADEWQGYVMGWLSRRMRALFAIAGDLLQAGTRSLIKSPERVALD